jgi:hypothetical protein
MNRTNVPSSIYDKCSLYNLLILRGQLHERFEHSLGSIRAILAEIEVFQNLFNLLSNFLFFMGYGFFGKHFAIHVHGSFETRRANLYNQKQVQKYIYLRVQNVYFYPILQNRFNVYLCH